MGGSKRLKCDYCGIDREGCQEMIDIFDQTVNIICRDCVEKCRKD